MAELAGTIRRAICLATWSVYYGYSLVVVTPLRVQRWSTFAGLCLLDRPRQELTGDPLGRSGVREVVRAPAGLAHSPRGEVPLGVRELPWHSSSLRTLRMTTCGNMVHLEGSSV